MLDTTNSNVLSYLRVPPAGGAAVVVSMNMSSQPQTIHLDVTAVGMKGNRVKTLLTNESSLTGATKLSDITLPPYASWVATVE